MADSATSDKLIRLLMVKESSNDAEAIISTMRNAGFAVRSSNVEDEEDLQNAISQQPWDLLISSLKLPNFDAFEVLKSLKASGKDIPVIVTSDNYEDGAAYEVQKAGARDYVVEHNPELLLLVIAREIADLSERRSGRHNKNLYLESEKRNRSLLDSSRDAIAYIHEGMHVYSNANYLEMFDLSGAEDIEGITIMDLISPDDQKEFKNILKRLSKGDNPEEEFEFTGVTDNEKKFKAIMEFSAASIEGEPCTQIIIRTKSEGNNKALEKELDTLRKQDLLTGLYNRQHFNSALTDAIMRASKDKGSTSSALLHLEPDEFKSLSESLGAAASDMLLTDVATIIRKHIQKSDIPARYAGSVFNIIIDEQSEQKIKVTAEAIRHAVEKHVFEIDNQSVSCTCSIGITQITETNVDSKKVLTQADSACKRAITLGGNSVYVHTEADEKAINERDQQWIQTIKDALSKNKFHLAYQPIVSLHAEPGQKYEVLLRLLDDKNKEIMPGEFLGAAEQAGLMVEIDRWVIKQSVKVLASKRSTESNTQFFIKISYDSLKDRTLLIWISKLLKAARLHGECLVFECSESAVLTGLKETKMFVNGLKQLHCHFAIDHVGSETNSFKYFNHFDADYLKVDGSLITDIAGNEKSQELVKSITEMAKAENKLTIAEHVQDANALAILWQCGINFIQGYYLQKPEKNLNYDFTSDS